MYICLCKAVTCKDIRNSIDAGANSYRGIREQLGVGTQCGQCACYAKQFIKETTNQQNLSSTQLGYPA